MVDPATREIVATLRKGTFFGENTLISGEETRVFTVPPPPAPRTKWTRRVPHPVLIGHAASLTPY